MKELQLCHIQFCSFSFKGHKNKQSAASFGQVVQSAWINYCRERFFLCVWVCVCVCVNGEGSLCVAKCFLTNLCISFHCSFWHYSLTSRKKAEQSLFMPLQQRLLDVKQSRVFFWRCLFCYVNQYRDSSHKMLSFCVPQIQMWVKRKAAVGFSMQHACSKTLNKHLRFHKKRSLWFSVQKKKCHCVFNTFDMMKYEPMCRCLLQYQYQLFLRINYFF